MGTKNTSSEDRRLEELTGPLFICFSFRKIGILGKRVKIKIGSKKKKSLKASGSPIQKHVEIDTILPFPKHWLIVWITCQAGGWGVWGGDMES